jgi:molecular chaperone HtpG
MEKGNISVQTENIFPIIKRFLYSDHEIFLRELVSNAVDATTKLKALSNKGIYKGEVKDLNIEIKVNKKKKTITISDKGLGLNGDEAKKYLNQVAFSSASEFLENFKEDASGIIGHFGLGFYSAFMVADKVEVDSLSYQEGSEPILWACEGQPEFTLKRGKRKVVGTDVILHINEDGKDFLEDSKIQELLDKYCKFLPVPIKFGTKEEVLPNEQEKEKEGKKIVIDNIVNNTNPLWKKNPSELNDEDYRNFYRELYPFSESPMFWIHLNIDYPFNLTGVLFFPKLKANFEFEKNKIQLYSNQVFVTDDVKDIVPEFLMLLHGVIDSPDIPLNVSRSYLQGDSNVKKISSYITKKVADKLNELFKNDRNNYETKWMDLSPFVKYGIVSDEKFAEKANKFVLLQNTDDSFFTLEEYVEKVKELQTDKHGKIVHLYTNNKDEHHSYIAGCKSLGYDVLIMDNVLDNHFMQNIEYKGDKKVFVRVDSDSPDNLVQKDVNVDLVLNDKDKDELVEFIKRQNFIDGAQVEVKALPNDSAPILITKPEFMRRMKEMQSLQGMSMDSFPDSYQLVVNGNHSMILDKVVNEDNEEIKKKNLKYLVQLAKLNQNMLKGEDLLDFTKRALDLL